MQTGPDSDHPRGENLNLLRTAEGRVFLAGVLLALLLSSWLMVNFLLGTENARALMAMTTSNILFGRAAGISFGYSAGFGHAVVIPFNMVTESILVLLFYPLFVFSWNQFVEIKALKPTMAQLRAAADRHKDRITRYGMVGLFLFVWLPFWMTGPVVGAVIGFLIDLRPARNLTIVLSGTFVAMCTWALLLHELHDRAAAVSSYGPAALVLVIVILTLLGNLLQRRNR